MTTAIEICSNALLELGQLPISSFDEGNDRARLCANLYPNERNAQLRSHFWNCAVKRVQLTPQVAVPAYGFKAKYLLPGDWLRTLRVGTDREASLDFRQEGREILCDAGSIFLRYVWRNENEGSWDALLIEVMQARMKWKLAYPITKSTSLRAELRDEWRLMLKQAKSIDSMDEPGESVADESPLITARY